MPRTRIAWRVALALVIVASALIVVLVAGSLSGSDDGGSAETDPITATASYAPRVVLFGDTLVATVDVVVDRTVIDPESVEVRWSHAPWKSVSARPARSERESGSTAYLRTTYTLRCLTQPCVPTRETETVELEPARVTYAGPVGGSTSRLSLEVPWPALVVHPRVHASDSTQRDALASPWRVDTVTLPAVSYRISPGALLALLVVAGAAFLAAAAVIAYRALPEKVPPPEPEPEPPPVVAPLEQALALLEAPATANGAKDRRRALEFVAEEVERWGDDELALDARTLAWSEEDPAAGETRALAARLRRRLEKVNGVPA